MRKICVVTGSRADYGLLFWSMKEISNDQGLELQIIATGMHLSPEFGLTFRNIEQDGFIINEKIEMLLSSDTPEATSKSVGLAMIGFADAYKRLDPDLVLLLGDRFEIFAAATTALIAKIPIAHIAGGDSTEGAYDEAFRHSITKMSHLHFVTNSLSAERLKNMGEDPQYVYNFGSPGIDYIRKVKLKTRTELENELHIRFREKNFLVTFHPVTLETDSSEKHFSELLESLRGYIGTTSIFITFPNADTGGKNLFNLIKKFEKSGENIFAFDSLGSQNYVSLLSHCSLVIGNSSSGLYEAPSFHIPTVNIGDRQKGRLMPESVINCAPKAIEINRAIQEGLQMKTDHITNPYGDGFTSKKIVDTIKSIQDLQILLKKKFHSN